MVNSICSTHAFEVNDPGLPAIAAPSLEMRALRLRGYRRLHYELQRSQGRQRWVSRFPRKERLHMPVSPTTPGRLGACDIAPIRIAFRQQNNVSARKEGTFAAQWLAYALPCQRFADALAGSRA